MRLDVSVFVYVLLLAHTYIRISAYIRPRTFIYIQIFLLPVGGKGQGRGRECEKGRVGELGMKNGIVSIKMISFFS